MQQGTSASAPAAAPAQASGAQGSSQATANVFTADQLHTLRHQILAFKNIKVHLCSRPFVHNSQDIGFSLTFLFAQRQKRMRCCCHGV